MKLYKLYSLLLKISELKTQVSNQKTYVKLIIQHSCAKFAKVLWYWDIDLKYGPQKAELLEKGDFSQAPISVGIGVANHDLITTR